MRARGLPAATRARWLARSAVHHSVSAASALGSRADRLPGAAQRALSLEGRGRAPADERGLAVQQAGPWEAVLRVSRDGPVALDDPVPGLAERRRLHIAVVIRSSGAAAAATAVFNLVSQLERAGHTCSIWVHDPFDHHGGEGAAVLRRRICEFTSVRAPAFKGFDDWYGADVAVATGWDTVYPVLLLPWCRARAYLINDHEPDFFASSIEALWAARTYELGLYGISASRWLRDLLARRYGQRGSWFRLAVDPRPTSPRR